MVGNEGSLLLVSQMFVLAIKGGSTTNRGLAATDTPTDSTPVPTAWMVSRFCLSSLQPHPTSHHLCPYVYDIRFVVESFTVVLPPSGGWLPRTPTRGPTRHHSTPVPTFTTPDLW